LNVKNVDGLHFSFIKLSIPGDVSVAHSLM